MEPTIAYIMGIIVGAVLTTVLTLVRTEFGILYIDRSAEDMDKYNIAIGKLDNLHKKKHIKLRVKVVRPQK